MLRMIVLVMLFTLQPVAGSADENVARYFPNDAWRRHIDDLTQAGRSRSYEPWFGGQLAAMEEPSLALTDGFKRAPNEIRLLILPSFDPGSMLRISYSDRQEVSFVFKAWSAAGGVIGFSGVVDETDSDRIFALLEAIDPWSDAVPPIFGMPLCMDGTLTVLEFRKGNDYKVIQRDSCDLVPMPNDDIRKLIHAFNDVSEGLMIAPHTFEPEDWMKDFDRQDPKLAGGSASAQSKQEPEGAIEWPTTCDGAVTRLSTELPQSEKAKLAAMAGEDLILLHHGFGTGIRNEFGLWAGNVALMESCIGGTTSLLHPDEVSMIIIERLWASLQ